LRIQERLAGEHQELLLRPVPSAGAIHEIETYLVVHSCDGLSAGLYHYHPEKHALFRLPASPKQTEALLNDAAQAWGQPDVQPHILVVLTTRFSRVAWKYEGIAYRLSLLNAGAIIQSLYTMSTAMELACCALGGGNSVAFAAASGLNPLEETSIAEVAIGSLQFSRQ
jgi:SagB-type dehydrogenase family enzyme